MAHLHTFSIYLIDIYSSFSYFLSINITFNLNADSGCGAVAQRQPYKERIIIDRKLHQLNKIDRNILRVLQKDGRTSFAELARQVGLSTTPCKERVKRLEREGVIRGYQAILNPSHLDAALVVIVQIRLNRTSQDIFEDFKRHAYDLPEVQECYLVSGNFDYLIKARVADMAAYREFLGETLLTLPGVQESTSYVVMEQVKETLALEIPY